MHASPVVRGGDDLILRKWGTCTARTKICQMRRKCCFCQFYKKSTKFEDKWQWHSLIPSISKPRPVWSNEICCFSMICGEFVEIPVESSESSSPRLPSHKFPADNRAVSLSTGHSGWLDMLCCDFWTRQLYNWTFISSSNTTHGKSQAIHTGQ